VSFYKQYFTIIGLLALTIVISILLLPPSMILAHTVTFIDTKSFRSSPDETPVRTKMDIGNIEHMRGFPKAIGKWEGIDYETSEIEARLHADVILMRAYQSPDFYQSIFLLIMKSTDPGTFHRPSVCYSALGYQIEEMGKEEIPLLNAEWVSYWRSEAEQKATGSINANRLVVFKESNGKVTERRVVLYFYVKERPFSDDELTMIRVSALVPINMSYDGVLSLSKEFMGEVVPYLFEFYEHKEKIIAAHLAESGAGWLLMTVSVIIPLAIIIYPRRLPKKPFDKKRETTAVVEEQPKFTIPELLAEVENNHRIATESWAGKLLPFYTSVWDRSVEAVHTLPANLQGELRQAYVDMGLANSIVWLSTELGHRSHNLDESYIKLCTSIAARLDGVIPLLKRSDN